jgi:AraC family transcriptional regulator, regulatory protein of adaptative response / DNA-3-methyladenine glycosylase II
VDFESCYRAVESKDARFDGYFVTAVTTTGIYCRPSCPAITPKRSNVRFYTTAAGAQLSGFRACKRCLPDAAPGSPEWNVRSDLAGRAMRCIAEGVVDHEGVAGLARRLGYSERHVRRQLRAELGAGPIALARAQRAQTARVLLERTSMTATDIAFAAGFASVRQFNDTMRQVFASSPTELRTRSHSKAPAANGTLTLRLPYRQPFNIERLLEFLGRRAVDGIESYADGVYSRSLRLQHGPAIVELSNGSGPVLCTLWISDVRDVADAVNRCRWILDVDADSETIDSHLETDTLLAPLVSRSAGTRVPGAGDGGELAVRAVLGQQVSVAAARKIAGRFVAQLGSRLDLGHTTVSHLFPTPAAIAESALNELGMPNSRRNAVRAVAEAIAATTVDLTPGADREESHRRLLEVPGIGTWTAGYVMMRALRDPDVFLSGDLGVRTAARRLGDGRDPSTLKHLAERLRPWGSYATQYLWGSLT